MNKDILRKLEAQLNKGITTEAEVVYTLTEIRKILEREKAKTQYKYLTFHCDWVVHPHLAGPTAQEILRQFDAANVQLKKGMELKDLPGHLRLEIDRISKMRLFEKEFTAFLTAHGLPDIDSQRPDGWIHFLHLYGRVVEDCPLIMNEKKPTSSINNVTVHVVLAKEAVQGEMLYKISWTVLDKNGKTGEIFVMNSFSLTAQ
jgi:hypothetical protein